jgi:hypothetical protein
MMNGSDVFVLGEVLVVGMELYTSKPYSRAFVTALDVLSQS